MPAQTGPTFLRAATRRRSGYADMRVSDAERGEVADMLSKHYADGRLDQAEYDERLERAMKARTYRDLGGLFDDLPAEGETIMATQSGRPSRRYRYPTHRILLLAVVAVVAIAAAHALAWSVSPWISIALLGLLILSLTRTPRRG